MRKKAVVYIAAVLLAVFAVVFIYEFRVKIARILDPFFLAILLAYIIKPLADRLVKKKLPYGVSILMIYLLFILSIAAACVFFFPELAKNAKDLMSTLPDIMTGYERMLNGFLSAIKSSEWSDDIKNMIFKEIQNGMSVVQGYAANTLRRALGSIIDLAGLFIDLTVAMVIAYYAIKDAEIFKGFALSMAPRRWRNGISGTLKEIDLILSGFIRGQILTAFIVGVMETAGLLIIKVKYPLILGMFGGLANIIPYFGPYIGVVPAAAIALIQSPLKALWTVIIFAAVQQIDNSFISPKVIEGKLGLHPVATIFAVLVGGEFFGILGMLLSVPVLAILRVIFKRIVDSIA